jgi:hypothetical protein
VQPKALFPIVNGGEPAVMFCWSFLLIAVLSGGPLALEALIGDRARPMVAGQPVVIESEA